MANKNKTNRRIQVSIISILLFAVALTLFVSLSPTSLFEPDLSLPLSETAELQNSGNWWEVNFSRPGNNNTTADAGISTSLIEHINHAQKTIHLAVSEFNRNDLASALIAAHNRGAQIRWLTDDQTGLNKDAAGGHGQFALLQGIGIEVKGDTPDSIMENNFIIFDGQSIWMSSSGLSQSTVPETYDNAIFLDSRDIAGIFELEFSEMWAGAFGQGSPSTINEQHAIIASSPIQVLFAPEDDPASWLFSLIADAKHSIYFVSPDFSWPELGSSFLLASQKGIEVQGIIEKNSFTPEQNLIQLINCSGGQITINSNPGETKHKFIVIDEKLVVLGSTNFFILPGLSQHDSTIILISDKNIAAQYLLEFHQPWLNTPISDADRCP